MRRAPQPEAMTMKTRKRAAQMKETQDAMKRLNISVGSKAINCIGCIDCIGCIGCIGCL